MRNRISAIEGVIASLNPDGTKKTFGMGVQEADEIVNAAVLVAGDVDRPAQEVPRGFLQILSDVDAPTIKSTSSGRRELAEWLASDENPLTARVYVNRVWLKLFGSPLVATPNNWGVGGAEPTHPELLDDLAVRFMNGGWSTKSLIREIVLSDAYRRSSAHRTANVEADPDNTLYWRMSPRQLDAESFRDAMLAAGGNLDLSRPRSIVGDLGNGRIDRGPGAESRFEVLNNFRSVYLPVLRDGIHESLELFDFPDPNVTSAQRQESIVPPQGLYLMNGSFAIGQAEKMADGMLAASTTLSNQIRWAFLTAYGRSPTSTELNASVRFLRGISPMIAKDPVTTSPRANGPIGRPGGMAGRPDRPRGPGAGRPNRPGLRPRPGIGSGRPGAQQQNKAAVEKQALTLFCQTLLASAEFRILD